MLSSSEEDEPQSLWDRVKAKLDRNAGVPTATTDALGPVTTSVPDTMEHKRPRSPQVAVTSITRTTAPVAKRMRPVWSREEDNALVHFVEKYAVKNSVSDITKKLALADEECYVLKAMDPSSIRSRMRTRRLV